MRLESPFGEPFFTHEPRAARELLLAIAHSSANPLREFGSCRTIQDQKMTKRSFRDLGDSCGSLFFVKTKIILGASFQKGK